MDLAPYRQKYGRFPLERRDWPVDVAEFKPDGHWREVPRLWDELSPERIVGGRQLWDHVTEVIDQARAKRDS